MKTKNPDGPVRPVLRYPYNLRQRASAAFLAIWRRCSGVRTAARLAPPVRPPLRPETAFTLGSGVTTWPVAFCTTSNATWLMSRFGIPEA